MDWKDVGRLVAPLAPVAGSILGGFLPIPGGSIIGQKFGELIAGAFGVAPTPQAVSDAVANAGRDEAVAKINAATEQARIQIDGFVELEKATLAAIVANLGQVNQTIQAELGHEHPFYTGWRPYIGWVFGNVAGAFGLMLVIAVGRAAWLSPDPVATLKDAWPVFLAFFGPLGAVLGVLVNGRSQEKVAAIASSAPMPNAKPAPVMPPAGTPPPAIAKIVKTVQGIIPKPPGSKD